MKKKLPNIPSLLLAMAFALIPACQSRAALSLVNADFQATTGLTIQPGGWYKGVPNGWTGVDRSEGYSVRDFSGNLVANLQAVGPGGAPFRPFYQDAGLLDSAAVVSLSFDIIALSAGSYDVRAGIFNTNGSPSFNSWTELALSAGITTDGRYTLQTSAPIASGTRIGVAFWQGVAGAGGIDNVTLIPEPSALSLLMIGSALTFLVASRRRR